MSRRVVVSGLGLISPLSASVDSSWDRLIKGESGIIGIKDDYFDSPPLASRVAGFVPVKSAQKPDGLQIDEWIPLSESRVLDEFSILAKIAARQAWHDAGAPSLNQEERERAGVIIGSGIGGLPYIEKTIRGFYAQNKRMSPFFIPASISNIVAGHLSKDFGFHGPSYTTVSACASSGHAIQDAVRYIKEGDADLMITGGTESALCYTGIAGFVACRALSKKFNDNPAEASRPWDRDRDGFVMGAGAGILILEEYERAKRRGAKIYAEIVGYGSSCDAHHITAPHPEGYGAKLAMKNALRKANIAPQDVEYINAHGTSTPAGDEIELNAVHDVFKDNKILHMSSVKSSIGHLLGAAAGAEAVFTLLSLKYGILPPTLNLHNSINTFNNINLIPRIAIEKKIKYAMSNSFGFGGTNVSLLFKKI